MDDPLQFNIGQHTQITNRKPTKKWLLYGRKEKNTPIQSEFDVKLRGIFRRTVLFAFLSILFLSFTCVEIYFIVLLSRGCKPLDLSGRASERYAKMMDIGTHPCRDKIQGLNSLTMVILCVITIVYIKYTIAEYISYRRAVKKTRAEIKTWRRELKEKYTKIGDARVEHFVDDVVQISTEGDMEECQGEESTDFLARAETDVHAVTDLLDMGMRIRKVKRDMSEIDETLSSYTQSETPSNAEDIREAMNTICDVPKAGKKSAGHCTQSDRKKAKKIFFTKYQKACLTLHTLPLITCFIWIAVACNSISSIQVKGIHVPQTCVSSYVYNWVVIAIVTIKNLVIALPLAFCGNTIAIDNQGVDASD